jgi:hypothetical protein
MYHIGRIVLRNFAVVFKHAFLVLVIDIRRDLVDRIIAKGRHSLFVA